MAKPSKIFDDEQGEKLAGNAEPFDKKGMEIERKTDKPMNNIVKRMQGKGAAVQAKKVQSEAVMAKKSLSKLLAK